MLAHKTLLLRMTYYEKRLNVLEMNWVLQNSDIQMDGLQDLNRDIAFHAFEMIRPY